MDQKGSKMYVADFINSEIFKVILAYSKKWLYSYSEFFFFKAAP